MLDVHSNVSLHIPVRQPQEEMLPKGCCPPIGTALSSGVCNLVLRSFKLQCAILNARTIVSDSVTNGHVEAGVEVFRDGTFRSIASDSLRCGFSVSGIVKLGVIETAVQPLHACIDELPHLLLNRSRCRCFGHNLTTHDIVSFSCQS